MNPRTQRLKAADMMNTDEAAEMLATSRVTINARIKARKVLALPGFVRGFKLPRWQFEPVLIEAIPALFDALQTRDPWQVLDFLETPRGGLGGITPRAAMEQGVKLELIQAHAVAEAHR